MKWSRWRRAGVVMMMALLALALATGAAATADGRALVTAVLVLPEVLPDAPVRPLAAVSAAPVREEVIYPTDAGDEAGTLYRPAAAGRHGAVILHLGVNPDPDDATLHALAGALARSGVVALIPRSRRLLAGDIAPDEVDALVGAFQYLQGRAEVDGRRVGFAGFCVGASLSALAAADPRIADEVAFVNFFGGWADTRATLAAVITGRQQYGDIDEAWQPQEMTRQVFVRHLLAALADAGERRLLEEAARSGGLPADLRRRLSPAGQTLFDLLSAQDADEVMQQLDGLPAAMRDRLARLSPAEVAPQIRARVFIMHDRNDSYVPFMESRRFADALGQGRATVTEFRIFQHMHPKGAGDSLTFAWEIGKLFRHLHGVLAQVS